MKKKFNKSSRELMAESINLGISISLNTPMMDFFNDEKSLRPLIVKFCKENNYSFESGYNAEKKYFTAKMFTPSELYISEFKDILKESGALASAFLFTLDYLKKCDKDFKWNP